LSYRRMVNYLFLLG